MNGSAKAFLIAVLTLAAAAAAPAQELEPPRLEIVLAGGGSAFRGGVPESYVSSAVPFQPDVTDPTVALAVQVRLARHVAVELEAAAARGRTRKGAETPHNTFLSGGFVVLFPVARGRLVPYASIGGGVVIRKAQDGFERTIEDAFGVRRTDPQGHVGAGIEWRLGSRFGARADYRYFRIFPEDPEGLPVERRSYGPHRLTGGLTLSF